MTYEVLVTDDASRDLADICGFIAQHDDAEKAKYVLAQIENAFGRLAAFPFRGVTPSELAEIGGAIIVRFSSNRIGFFTR